MAHPNFLIDTTFSSKNIASPASVYDYTVLADAILYFSVQLTIAGNGDYIAYLTRQWAGAGGVAILLPKTTGASAAGETTIEFITGPVIVRTGDVFAVMIDGLTGDISVSGKIRIAAEAVPVANDIRDAILSDSTPFPGANIDAKISSVVSGSTGGLIHYTYTVLNGVLPIDDVQVVVSTDAAKTNIVGSRRTDAFGQVTFDLDPGTYYFWCSKTGYTFTNPDIEEVS